ncbi:MAG TPA: hypothetical protein VKV37_01795 [Ktedonobacteraceae bacterium]|jgi:hypothetical protein|nr:hypothetical protein [Ktedonobacteraceae bacterium]
MNYAAAILFFLMYELPCDVLAKGKASFALPLMTGASTHFPLPIAACLRFTIAASASHWQHQW